jgi:hypothetical protein
MPLAEAELVGLVGVVVRRVPDVSDSEGAVPGMTDESRAGDCL